MSVRGYHRCVLPLHSKDLSHVSTRVPGCTAWIMVVSGTISIHQLARLRVPSKNAQFCSSFPASTRLHTCKHCYRMGPSNFDKIKRRVWTMEKLHGVYTGGFLLFTRRLICTCQRNEIAILTLPFAGAPQHTKTFFNTSKISALDHRD